MADSSLGEANEEDLPLDENLNDRVRHGDPHASSKVSVMGSSAEHIGAKKINSESCEQVNVNSPDMPSVSHKTQDRNHQDGGGH